MDFFDEIKAKKKELPRKNAITDEFSKYSLNFYQIFAIGFFLLMFFLGIFLGNLFATCQATSFFYADQCIATEFNYSIMIFVWFIGLLISIFIFAIGHIIEILREINKKLSKLK